MSAFEMSPMPWTDMDGQSMNMAMSGPNSILVLFVMWWVMMVAMMLPGAAPTILLTAALNRRSTSDHPPFGTAALFALGYLLAWLFFSLVAAVAQWLLESNGLLSAMMNSKSNYLTAGLLLAAGVWQFSPIKRVCLRHCRSPIEFVTRQRRPGNRGALVMGFHHGTYCLGCCWFPDGVVIRGWGDESLLDCRGLRCSFWSRNCSLKEYGLAVLPEPDYSSQGLYYCSSKADCFSN